MANERRNHEIFEEYAYLMIDMARESCSIDRHVEDEGLDFNIYALDSTTIDLCLSVFWWAEFRDTKAGIKVHTLLDVNTSIPSYYYITEANVHDVNIWELIHFEEGSFYTFDRAYIDFNRLYDIQLAKAFFVTRAKRNIRFRCTRKNKSNTGKGVLYDYLGKLEGKKSSEGYPASLRMIGYHDEEMDKELVFLTNNMELAAHQIALLYKKRWEVELFFKWMKQHMKIRSFWGRTMNAVKIQIHCAMIAYCLVNIVTTRLKSELSIYSILQILSVSLLDKTPVNELLTKSPHETEQVSNPNQLKINYF
jgi:hypothetical protein